MHVDIIRSEVSDNFFYVVADDDGTAALIDPIDGAKAVTHVREAGYDLEWVVNTHFHHDHVGGNDAVFDAFGDARLAAAGGDAERIAQGQSHTIDRKIGGGDTLEVGQFAFDVLATPGHTPGHISLLGDGHLFSGDTIFVGGAGNCSFGGDAGVLFETFKDVLRALDEDTTFYPGHDYSVRNLEFILSIDRGNPRAERVLEEARACGDGAIFVTTLGRELTYNPFMRYDDPALEEELAHHHADVFEQCKKISATREEAIFRTVRELRNHW